MREPAVRRLGMDCQPGDRSRLAPCARMSSECSRPHSLHKASWQAPGIHHASITGPSLPFPLALSPGAAQTRRRGQHALCRV